MAPPRCFLLEIPPETRCVIYEFYVATEGGYWADFETGKLQTRGKDAPIDLSLMYTCKLVAEEMHGVALRHITINFSTVFSESLEYDLERMDEYRQTILKRQRSILFCCLHKGLCLEARNEIEPDFPLFAQALDEAMSMESHPDYDQFYYIKIAGLYKNTWPQAPSLWVAALRRTVRHIASTAAQQLLDASSPLIMKFSYPFFRRRVGEDILWETVSSECDPWVIPDGLNPPHFRRLSANPVKLRVSAAAASIRFLAALPASTRSQLRNISLEEDFPSIPHPECHAQGLIPFCVENRKLRVERRLHLWTNCATRAWSTRIDASKDICSWIVEAHALPAHGMPPESFSLILDGNPAPHRCTELFQTILHRDMAWASAIDARLGQPLGGWFALRGVRFGILSQAMADMLAGKSNTRCNFDPGQSWDANAHIPDFGGGTEWEMRDAFNERRPRHFQTAPPMLELGRLAQAVLENPSARRSIVDEDGYARAWGVSGLYVNDEDYKPAFWK